MDPLDLIAEARKRQEAAERDRDYWKEVAESRKRRCRLVIDMAKLRPVPPPHVHEGDIADFDQLAAIVDDLARVISDPYARHDDDEDGITHDRIKFMMTYRLQQMIEAASKRRTLA